MRPTAYFILPSRWIQAFQQRPTARLEHSKRKSGIFAADFFKVRQAASIMIHRLLSGIKGTLLHMRRSAGWNIHSIGAQMKTVITENDQ
ncbi:hypothetical protein EBAPG3_15000 [Nitrosospira lacus]|uniref:Uncharacterized protein n=1 Tax=Nitrosospira lacus TaxID=1288494 RepID=A0A1W6SLM9_9PROT|nr:hypothetical protein EBAPG3_15000 [Nitrosospira lacus]